MSIPGSPSPMYSPESFCRVNILSPNLRPTWPYEVFKCLSACAGGWCAYRGIKDRDLRFGLAGAAFSSLAAISHCIEIKKIKTERQNASTRKVPEKDSIPQESPASHCTKRQEASIPQESPAPIRPPYKANVTFSQVRRSFGVSTSAPPPNTPHTII